ncbi:hypothetical protein [Algicola sagamiensis]|uniref:hypothetical protein n=1 Tax=Algicola sagamiensis TaxID=163869 RepID=UPI00039F63B2|nr:hypothetical protein [Algicola sagamiensis]
MKHNRFNLSLVMSTVLLASCGGDNNDTQIKPGALTVQATGSLPFAVELELGNETKTLTSGKTTFSESNGQTPRIKSVAGPQECELRPAANNTVDIRCDEYVVAYSKVQPQQIANNQRVTKTQAVSIDQVNSREDQVDGSSLTFFDDRIWFSGNINAYQGLIRNGRLSTLDPTQQKFIDYFVNGNVLYGLSASNGVFQLKKDEEVWTNVISDKTPSASKFYPSGGKLAYVQKNGTNFFLKQFNPDTQTTLQVPSEAIPNTKTLSDLGPVTLNTDGGIQRQVLLSVNQSNEWSIQAIFGGKFNNLTFAEPLNRSYTVWNETTLLSTNVNGANHVHFLKMTSSPNTLSWEKFNKEENIRFVGGSDQLLILTDEDFQDRTILKSLYVTNEDKLTAAKIAQHTGVAEDQLHVQLHKRETANDTYPASPIKSMHGWMLFFAGDLANGQAWLTDGKLEKMRKMGNPRTWSEFKHLKIVATGKEVVVVTDNNEQIVAQK